MKLKIEKMVYGGYGLCHGEGKTFLVKGAYPGEEVEAKIVQSKKGFSFAKTQKILQPSKFRIIPSCRHFKECGGCEWMDISYKEQLKFKQEIFVEQMKRIAKFNVKKPEIFETKEKHYRNKAEFVVRNSELGFFQEQSHNFVKIKECEILSERLNEVKKKVDIFLKKRPRFSSKVEHVVLREGNNETMVIFISSKDLTPPFLKDVDNVVSLKRKVHSHVVVSGKERVHQGKGTIDVKINDIQYQVPAKSFFQVNYEGAKILSSIVKEYAQSGDKLLDLYCGIGFFSLQLHDKFKRIFGIESSPSSILQAQKNVSLNGFDNIEFKAQKIEKWESKEKFDVVVVDPPRSGLRNTAEKVALLSKKKIVYVSCDSSTFARDTKILMKNGFELKNVKIVDMFPQTHHFEVVGLFER